MHLDFIAYAGDCRVGGTVDVSDGERLTDVLNHTAELSLRDVELVGHVDGRIVRLAELELPRDELFAVEAVGARGDPTRRIHTVRHRLELKLGPYTVLGQLHAQPGGQPLVAIARRSPMIPLTNATIAFNEANQVVARDIGTLIVNRELADWVRADITEREAFPGIPEAAPAPFA
jgi:hypothetical protein